MCNSASIAFLLLLLLLLLFLLLLLLAYTHVHDPDHRLCFARYSRDERSLRHE